VPLGGGARLPLRERVVLADGRSGALVGADGSVDWWCPDRFDGPPLLWRLLDPEGAAIRLGPVGPSHRSIAYDGPTMVGRSLQDDGRGAVETLDVLDGLLLRVVTVVKGEVDLEIAVAPGRSWRRSKKYQPFDGGVVFDGWVLRAPGFAFSRSEEGARAQSRLRNGDRVVVTLDRLDEDPLSERDALQRLADQRERWRRLAASTLYEGPGAEAVRRSVLLLSAIPTRSITTSLAAPGREEMAVDSRHTFVGDACAGHHLLGELGHPEPAADLLAWLVRVVPRGWPLAPAYAFDGEPAAVAEDRPGVAGWRGAPVRVGFGGEKPVTDLDLAGALATVVAPLAVERWPALVALADDVAEEVPSSLVEHVRCWAFLDEAVRVGQARNPLDLDAAGWRIVARRLERFATQIIGRQPEDIGSDPRLLRLTWQGPLPGGHELVARCVDHVLERRGDGAFVNGAEGASVAASFWAVRAEAVLGRWEAAHERFERLLAWIGPTGVLPRVVEPVSGRFTGDMPDASAHLALLAAARTLADGPR
jgi:hypothetical protein